MLVGWVEGEETEGKKERGEEEKKEIGGGG